MDLQIWGRVVHIGPGQFMAIASAVPTSAGHDTAQVLTMLEGSLDLASTTLRQLMRTLGEEIVARGDRIVDVEEIDAL